MTFFSKICHFASHKKHLFWLANFRIFQNLALICPYFFWYRLELLLHCFIYLTEGNSVILVPNWKDSFKKLEKFHEKLLSPLDFKQKITWFINFLATKWIISVFFLLVHVVLTYFHIMYWNYHHIAWNERKISFSWPPMDNCQGQKWPEAGPEKNFFLKMSEIVGNQGHVIWLHTCWGTL